MEERYSLRWSPASRIWSWHGCARPATAAWETLRPRIPAGALPRGRCARPRAAARAKSPIRSTPSSTGSDDRGERRSLFRYFQGRSSLATWLRAVLAQRYVDAPARPPAHRAAGRGRRTRRAAGRSGSRSICRAGARRAWPRGVAPRCARPAAAGELLRQQLTLQRSAASCARARPPPHATWRAPDARSAARWSGGSASRRVLPTIRSRHASPRWSRIGMARHEAGHL